MAFFSYYIFLVVFFFLHKFCCYHEMNAEITNAQAKSIEYILITKNLNYLLNMIKTYLLFFFYYY